LNQEIVKSTIVQHGARAIHCIAFPDTSDVDDHALASKKDRPVSFVQFEIAVVDEGSTTNDCLVIGNRAVLVLKVELPKVRHDAECHIKFSLRPVTDLPRRLETVADFATPPNRMLAGSRIQPLDVAVFLPVT